VRPIGSTGEDVDPLTALANLPTRDGRPGVRIVMIQSLDGVVAVDGGSRGLGGPGDMEVYLANRSLADVVLVGAETVRTERYGPARLTPALIEARIHRGQPPLPPIAVVSRSLELDADAPFFTEARARPIVITTTDADRDGVARLDPVADVITAGDDRVDLSRALDELGRRGARHVVCEGGPTLNGAMMRAGLVDEICLTVSPVLVGEGPRLVAGLDGPTDVTVHAAHEHGGFAVLVLRPSNGANPDA